MTSLKCEECGVGKYRPIKSAYVMRLGKHMMVMPDAPAYVCDVCGFRCFDDAFLESIHDLLKHTAAEGQRHGKRPQLARPEQPMWMPARRTR